MPDYEINEENLCEHCNKNFDNNSPCEGNNCIEAKESLLEENGITEISADSIQNLKAGNSIFLIVNHRIQHVIINSISYSEKMITIEIGDYNFDLNKKQMSKSSIYDEKDERGFFIKKEEAVKEYKKIIFNKMSEMMDMINKIGE